MAEKPTPLHAVLHLLRKYNLKGTEEILRREANIGDVNVTNIDLPESELTNVLKQHTAENDPYSYDLAYESLRKMIIDSVDAYKYELSMLHYPVLVHLFLTLITNGQVEHAHQFLDKYGPEQEEFYQDDIKKLSFIFKNEQIKDNEIAEAFVTNKFVVQLSRDASHIFKRFLTDQKSPILSSVIQNKINLVDYDGSTRPAAQVYAAAGSLSGEPSKSDNRLKVFHGLLKEPDYQSLRVETEEEEEVDEAPDKPKKKKAKKDPLFSKKAKSDPNAPPSDRIPLPELKEVEKLEKARAIREASKRAALGPDSPPSVCYYTLLNTSNATAVEVCDDSSLLAVGFANSLIKVWSLTPNKLRGMKSAEKLQDIDKEASDVLVRMMEEKDRDSVKTLYGHSGPVYGVSFDPFKQLLLSCSEDSTIRLWSLMLWSCVVVWRGHVWSVWDVTWSPHGHYFASCGHDRVARVWATDQHQPLRLLVGHLSDVQCVNFHPNSNYVVTGSTDRTVRLWDVLNGSTVRVFTGHKSCILSVCISPCGRIIASGGSDGVRLWDIPNASLIACLPHTQVYSLSFSRDNMLLASGSLEFTIRLWDLTAITESAVKDGPIYEDKDEKYLVRHFATKNSSIIHLHFTRRNLLLGVGPYEGNS